MILARPWSTPNGTAWLLPPKKLFSRVEIAGYFTADEALLPLPHGTFEIDDFPGLLRTNRLGVASVSVAQALLDFRADYWTGPSMDAPPGPADLAVPEEERPALIDVAQRLGLDKMTERQKIRAVSRFFQENFHYSLNGPSRIGRNDRKSPLAQFLTNTMSGHCEYFATATVLLLRQAGVKARYITGYAVPESARHGETYLVRERHRHAWALVYHSDTGMWEQIDNTPSTWADVAEAQPALVGAGARISFPTFTSTFQMALEQNLLLTLRPMGLGALDSLSGLAHSLHPPPSAHRTPRRRRPPPRRAWPGLDSELLFN